MSFFSWTRILVIVTLSVFSACLVEPLQAQAAFRTPFKLVGGSMIVVPLHIDHSGPLDFILDTGTSQTIIDRKLATDLMLVKVEERMLSGVEGSTLSAIFQTESISMAGVTLKGLRVSSRHACPWHARGVLGEDFLHNFDLLIDYPERQIEFEPFPARTGAGPTVIVSGISGERIPLALEGRFEGHATANRLTLPVLLRELSPKPLTLLLDSGADSFMVFNQPASVTLSRPRRSYEASSCVGCSGTLSAAVLVTPYVAIGAQGVSHATVIMPEQKIEADVDGVLPTALFHSIFISHSGRFVILNPVGAVP